MLTIATDWTAISAIATAAAALISAGVVVVALLQRGDSRESAQAAIRAAVAAEEAVEHQRQAAAEQSRLQTYPPVTIQFGRHHDGWVTIMLRNAGSLPALDVDIDVLGILWEYEWAPDEFAAQFIDDEDKLRELSEIGANSDSGFSVMDHLVYGALPPKTHVAAKSGSNS